MCSIKELTERRNEVATKNEAGTSIRHMRITLFIPCYIYATPKALP
jgi:hypothetical protein